MVSFSIQLTVEFTGSSRFLSGIKGYGLWSNQSSCKKKSELSYEETKFLKEIFKILIVMYENNF